MGFRSGGKRPRCRKLWSFLKYRNPAQFGRNDDDYFDGDGGIEMSIIKHPITQAIEQQRNGNRYAWVNICLLGNE